MFRGFKVSKGIEFERAVRQIEPELCKDYRGTSPRKQVAGTEVCKPLLHTNWCVFKC